MSSMFEGPSQPSRYFSAPPQRRLFWPKVIGAFAAGVVVTILISKIPSDSSPVPPPVQSSKISRVEAAKQRAEASKAAQERKAAARTEAPNDARPSELAGTTPPTAQPPAESSSAPQSAAASPQAPAPPAPDTTELAKQADELNCAQQTWPYVDRKCADLNGDASQTTRPVRVIPSDRSAPSSVVTAAPPDATVPLPQPSPRTTDGSGSAPPAPRTAERPRSTSAPAAEAPRDSQRKEAEAPVRPAPVNTAASSGRETTGHATAADPESVRETPPATKNASDRRQRRNASRRESEKNVTGETRRSREERGTVRNRAADDDQDEETVVREHRLSDGRRIIIQRRPADDDDGADRRVIIQRRAANRDEDAVVERAPAGIRMPPFFINPFAIGN